MKKTMMLVLVLFVFTMFSSAITVDKIINNNLKVKGGIDNIKAIKTIHITGVMKRMGMEMKLELWNKNPSRLKINIWFSGKKMTFGYNGKEVWQVSPFTGLGDKAQILTGEQAYEIKDNADEFEEMFLDYKKKGIKIVLIGQEDLEGTPVYKLKLT
jgi:outer membrane lipoprotein-sorting protein